MSTQQYVDNRPNYSSADLQQYRGKWVAFSLDGSQILASGNSELDLADKAERLGLSQSEYVMEPIPQNDTLLL